MDEGSTITLIDAKLAEALDVRGPLHPLEVSGIGDSGTADPSSQQVAFGIGALESGVIHEISGARTVTNLSLFHQSLGIDDVKSYPHLLQLPIEYYTNAKPCILIGQDNWHLITAIQSRHTSKNEPIASLTRLGWVVHGHISTTEARQSIDRTLTINKHADASCLPIVDLELNALVKASFTLDSIGVTNSRRNNKLVERAEQILSATAICKTNHWEVGLLWKNDDIRMPNNRQYALSRLRSLERKMDRDREYGERYYAQVEHLIQSNYARKVSEPMEDSPRAWYLPHFGVVNPNKPNKLRLVFDAAARTDGVCLNDNLLTGPDLVNSLLGVLMRFRQKRIAIKGDIREMFMQVKIRKEDQHAQRFLWRGMDRNREPETYVMTSMIFGSASSPYTAQYVMRQNA